MLSRAIAALIALPGVVAFAVPLALAQARGEAARHLAVALAVVSAGTLLLLWCVREFYVAGRGTLAPWDPPRHLVVTGPYTFSRNPMYIGVVVILVGWWLLWDSSALAIYALLVAVSFHLRVILAEEPWADRTFDGQWQAYRARVPRWLFSLSELDT